MRPTHIGEATHASKASFRNLDVPENLLDNLGFRVVWWSAAGQL